MGRFGCGAVLELGHFDTGPFWKWAGLTPILVSQYGFHFFTLKLFFLIINITNKNEKQTEGVILFPQLLCKKSVYYLLLSRFHHQLYIIMYNGRITHPGTNHTYVAYLAQRDIHQTASL